MNVLLSIFSTELTITKWYTSGNYSCAWAFNQIDTNNNGFITISELLVLEYKALQINDVEKAKQINCSAGCA